MEMDYLHDSWLIAVLTVVLICGCIQQAETLQTGQTPDDPPTTQAPIAEQDVCEELKLSFDEKIDSMSGTECNEWMENGKKPVWVGGRLIGRNGNRLTFQGTAKQGTINLYSQGGPIPYETGRFYRFDLGRYCTLFYSMQLSGRYSDPDLNALTHLNECD
ncbi:hypothetical protein ACFLRF_00055 [Candidatus Altiarchaeota archaeon]